MIEELHIENLGVLESAHVEFSPGLTVLTGETGAGKTMVLWSLQLLLGQRADSSKIRAGQSQAVVDGVFTIDPNVLDEFDLESETVVVSRKVSQSRSRAYLDRRPAPVSLLEDLASNLAVIHGQSDQIELRSPRAQREFLDKFGGASHADLVQRYTDAWNQAVNAKRALDEFSRGLDEAEAEIAQLRPVVQKVRSLDLVEGEDEALRLEAERITNVEELRNGLALAYRALVGEDGAGSVDAVGLATGQVAKLEGLDPKLAEISRRLNAQLVELETVRDDLAEYLEGLNADPSRLEYVHQRRRAITALLRGRALDIPALLKWTDEAEARLDDLERRDDRMAELQAELANAQRQVIEDGRKLSNERHKLAHRLSKLVDAELAGLSMKDARLLVEFKEREKPGPNGLEDIEMLLQAHPDANPAPLGSGASGGELSRVMLALEVVLAEHSEASATNLTYVFDEVDAGVGGRAAREVGKRLARLARDRQVLVVTHLAQVAAWADSHLLITKSGATTEVSRLTEEERIVELARMLSGSESSQTARAHAAELRSQVKVAQSRV
ncbi:DNA repair protein RecN [Actinomyces urinae]|uniref:DNA repair protein RecN n=1 Tax=Actinomyces urinae TaxID=1689268 RepID=UPI00093115C3|nr:DNA repair protein RecN [Actinomyces urinae]